MLRLWLFPMLCMLGACSPESRSLLNSAPRSALRIPQLGPVPALPDWPDNPPTEAKKHLGRLLYAERRLSGSGNTVCGTCHPSNAEFQSGGPVDLPDRSFPNLAPSLHRNAPSLLNIVYAPIMRWDGSHFTDLFDVMALPLAEANMNLSRGIPSHDIHTVEIPSAQEELKRRLVDGELQGYQPLYQEAFGVDVTRLSAPEIWRLTGQALAVYIRIAVSRDAPFDLWNAGDDNAISESAKRGAELFIGKGRCLSCHRGPFFSDFQFHNVSTSLPDGNGQRPDEGRYLVTGKESDRGAFLTPMLRSVARTSPYFHNAAQTRLAKVIRHFTSEAVKQDPLHDRLVDQPMELSDNEINDMVAFLKTLGGKTLDKELVKLPSQFPE